MLHQSYTYQILNIRTDLDKHFVDLLEIETALLEIDKLRLCQEYKYRFLAVRYRFLAVRHRFVAGWTRFPAGRSRFQAGRSRFFDY